MPDGAGIQWQQPGAPGSDTPVQIWFVAHTRPNAEDQAEHHLRRQGFAVYLPRYRKTRRHARRTELVVRPLFPRYLFVGVEQNSPWRSIRSTIGVSHLVTQGEMPLAVPEAVVMELRAREDSGGMIALGRQVAFAKGDPVEICKGALCARVGLFECIDDDARVVVLLDILGRQVRLRVPIDAVQIPA